MTQQGFGFAPVTFGAKIRRPSKSARLWRAGLFWMADDGTGARPLVASTAGQDEALALAHGLFPRAIVEVVND